MSDVIFSIGGWPVTGAGALAAALVVAAAVALARLVRGRSAERAEAEARLLDERVAEISRLQAEMAGRMQTMAEIFGSRQSDLARVLSDRLDGLSDRLGHSMVETTRSTGESLARIHERIGVIDRAQATIADLAGQVTGLRSILADKQARGAFGQGRMEAIVADALPPDGYALQATLASGARPDCLVFLPNGAAPIAIDAKFPLEGWLAWKDAADEAEEKRAGSLFRRDVIRHVLDIRDKYLVPGETQDTAFMFVPSESIFADLNEHFGDLVQKAHRARVVIVSPSLLVLSIQVVQALLRDQRMRDEAHVIQAEVRLLLDDVGRLADRVAKLEQHFSQATRDLGEVRVSADKVIRRGRRIETVEVGEAGSPPREAAVARDGDAAPTQGAPPQATPAGTMSVGRFVGEPAAAEDAVLPAPIGGFRRAGR